MVNILCSFMARSASSRASLSLSILIESLIIIRFGGDSARRIIFGGDSARRIILGGDLGRAIGDTRREGRIETGAGCCGGGGGGGRGGAESGGGTGRRATRV